MIRIHCVEDVKNARAFAGTLGEEAVESFEYNLYRYADSDQILTEYWRMTGFGVQHSFEFTQFKFQNGVKTFWYNGGLVYDPNTKKWGSHT